MNILDFQRKKAAHEKITMVTCYDYTSAAMLAKTDIDCVLVGDSLAMTMHGFQDTLAATIEMMVLHTAAVKRGIGSKFMVADLPFLSYRQSQTMTLQAVLALMQAGAHAVKLEGAAGNVETVRYLVESGVPVMGHLGLTPQYVNAFGGYRVQARTEAAAAQLVADANALAEAGCFALVLECVPEAVATLVTQQLSIPTIGIGAGVHTDGQVLVFQDLLGLNEAFKPKFVKTFLNGADLVKSAINDYCRAVQSKEFPGDDHTYQH